MPVLARRLVVAGTLLLPLTALATRSISACDPEAGECAIAVVTNPHGMPFMCPYGAPGVVVDVQAQADSAVGLAVLRNVEAGMGAAAALEAALEVAAHRDMDQIGVVTLAPGKASGVDVAAFTGPRVLSDLKETCTVTGPTFVVNAGLQTSAAVCQAMADAFVASQGNVLARRLLAALNAGTPVGTDARGEYSATIRGYSGTWWFYPDSFVSIGADVQFSLHWAEDLRWELELWLANWEYPGDIRERIVLTDEMRGAVLSQLHALGYFRGDVKAAWTLEAEIALQAWEALQFGWKKPTIELDGVRWIEQPVAVVLLEGRARDVLIPSPDGVPAKTEAGEGGCSCGSGGAEGLALAMIALATWRRRLGAGR